MTNDGSTITLRVLVIVSDEELRDSVCRQVDACGAETVAVHAVAEALEAFRHGSGFDVVVATLRSLSTEGDALRELLTAAQGAEFVVTAEPTEHDGVGRVLELVGERLLSFIAVGASSGALCALLERVRRRVQLEQTVEELEHRLENANVDWLATVDAIQDPIAVVDAEGYVIRANRSFALRFGRSTVDVIGTRDVELLHGKSEDSSLDDMRVGFLTYETSELAVPGTFLVSHYPIQLARGTCVVYHLTDISARRQAEEALRASETQLRQSQKMEAVGRLAGGVAHDFNNLLTTVIGYSELVLAGLEPGSNDYDAVTQISQAAQRGAGLTRQLLSFSRTQVIRPEVLDLNMLLSDVSKLLRPLIGEDIELEFINETELRQVRSDRGQLEQVLMNLAVNSRDAMPSGGTLTLRTENLERVLEASESGEPRVCVGLSVADTGEGMDEATLSRAFEPFFTTKPEGKGTGLGLSMVYAIAKQHDADIDVVSSPGKGTVVKLILPAVDARVSATTPRVAVKDNLKGRETILLVEDEESVRQVVHGILSSYGYRVIDAPSGAAATEKARALGGEFDLLLTDLVMPVMNGGELARAICADYPNVRVLIMSGYAPSSQRYRAAVVPGTPFIAKPFRPVALVQRLREVLDEERAG